MKQWNHRLLAGLLALVLAAGPLPAAALAAQPDSPQARLTAEAPDDWTREEREARYLEQLFYDRPTTFAVHDLHGLTPEEVELYHSMEAQVRQIAEQGGPAVYQLPEQLAFARQLTGPDPEALWDQCVESLKRVVSHLLYDYPENFYWIGRKSRYHMDHQVEQQETQYRLTQVQVSFSVDPAYQTPGQEQTVDNTRIARARQAREYAVQLAGQIAAQPADPVEQMRGMKDQICRMTRYNDVASQSEYEGGSDPWQLVYVFDQDPNTQVVCEGYAKAFQYLCDLVFPEGQPECLLVSGTIGRSNHMWNVVRQNGQGYLVDVTYCDDDRTPTDELFWRSPAGGGVEIRQPGLEYRVSVPGGGYGKNKTYRYNDFTCQLYSTEYLTLAEQALAPEEGFCVSGRVTSFLREADPVTLSLLEGEGGAPVASVTVTGSPADYRLEDVKPGMYTLQVSKTGHPDRRLSLTVSHADVTLDATLFPLGDVLADGAVDTRDWMRLQDHLQGTQALSGYALSCADTITDGAVDTRDWMRLQDHCQGNLLW